uniref:Uncharacterized protein n=1 Tax=Glossina morsitans morsitans TaxID=37546 RepID=A0A1B0F9J4_GLOMM
MSIVPQPKHWAGGGRMLYGVSIYTGSPIYNAVGSLLVGSLLWAVVSFIIYTNVATLVGRSIPQEHLERINSELESDIMIRAIHDVKAVDEAAAAPATAAGIAEFPD